MNKIFVLFILSFNAFADFNDDPYTTFNANERFTEHTVVDWKVVKDANKTCQEESRKRGFNGFLTHVEACTFWNENHGGEPKCTIITNNITNMHQIGHELRHCFQGPYHN